MCGIFGEITPYSIQTDRSVFLNLLQLSKTRGPDNQGYYSNKLFLQFGFNRLKVIDLTTDGDQPILSNNKRYLMLFNGEIYNYLWLKKKLIKRGANFRGSGDSEVLGNCFQYFGIKQTLELIDGMFAIALFDNFKKQLHLIRDFAGVKPLHYGKKNGNIVFASQLNQVAKHPLICDAPYNLDVLKLYLSQHFIPSPFGLIKNTNQVLPGEVITFDLHGNSQKYRFWELPRRVRPTIFNEEHAINAIESSLTDSVNKQMSSDVPLGVFLSSGVDSSLISLLAEKNTKNVLNAFTLGSNSTIHDETNEARIFSKLIGINQKLGKMDSLVVKNFLNFFEESITEPFSDFSLLPTAYISNIAKKDVTVILSGDGADELFFGYERFLSILKNHKIQRLPYYFKYLIYGVDKVLWKNKHINSNCLFDSPGDAHFHLHQRFSNGLIKKIFPNLSGISISKKFDIYNYDAPQSKNELLQFLRYSEFYGMMQKTLRKVDMASMHSSLEVRVPFLSKTVIEMALKIDPFLNFKNRQHKNFNNKNVLRKIILRNNKNLILSNIKKGFSVPLTRWLKQDLYKPISETIMDHSLANHFGVNTHELEKLISDHIKDKADNKWPIFTIYSLFIWKKNLSK